MADKPTQPGFMYINWILTPNPETGKGQDTGPSRPATKAHELVLHGIGQADLYIGMQPQVDTKLTELPKDGGCCSQSDDQHQEYKSIQCCDQFLLLQINQDACSRVSNR